MSKSMMMKIVLRIQLHGLKPKLRLNYIAGKTMGLLKYELINYNGGNDG